jgi:hypothetical protein
VKLSKTDTPATILSEVRPEIFRDAALFEAICRFYSPGVLIATDLGDLSRLLACPKLSVFSASGLSLKACAHALLDAYPDFVYAQGSLRFYEAPRADWLACEAAETALGDALASGTYAFEPDFFTLLCDTQLATYKLTAIVGEA